MEFDWKEFKKNEKIAVHCKTEEEAIDFLNECDKQGIKWTSGKKSTSYTFGNKYKENTIYSFIEPEIINCGLVYGDINTSINDADTILEWSDYMQVDLRELIKPCMVVKSRNGDVLMAYQSSEGICIADEDGHLPIERYNNDLTYNNHIHKKFDIVEIYGFTQLHFQAKLISTENRPLIWKREEKSKTQLKIEEIEKKQRALADELAKLRKGL